ncbi:hypothetical protein [Burkholderia sp. Ax-1724]|uniref:hypothetical protein n=1 Tax=Burkholderia sp. Ax-1724 TaxID=2608336 RepID=UPI00142440AF|nr:hypothetical protein [Burkholderia sp. Ax-1724]NIF56506.1 hypothetical protein [Burkholderia sp. Ax-1724]
MIEANRAALRRASKNRLVLCAIRRWGAQAIDGYQVLLIDARALFCAPRRALRQSTALQQGDWATFGQGPGSVVVRFQPRIDPSGPTSRAGELAGGFFYFYDARCRSRFIPTCRRRQTST